MAEQQFLAQGQATKFIHKFADLIMIAGAICRDEPTLSYSVCVFAATCLGRAGGRTREQVLEYAGQAYDTLEKLGVAAYSSGGGINTRIQN